MKTCLIAFLCATMLAAGACRTAQPKQDAAPAVEAHEDGLPDLGALPLSMLFIKQSFVDQGATFSDLYYGAIDGAVKALHDPYSEFFPPSKARMIRDALEGKISGIGVQLGKKDDALIVVATLEDSPAAKAGLLAGDVISAVDGTPVSASDIQNAVRHLQGKTGTKVALTIVRDDSDQPAEVVITRAKVSVPDVRWRTEKVGDKTIGIITLSQFLKDSDKKIGDLAVDAIASSLDGLVLDLRNNTGGRLDTGVNVVCLWHSDGPASVLVFRNKKEKPMTCKNQAILGNMPTVVLINKWSASASELTAGALKDYDKARLIGETTYGKGKGQTVMNFLDGSMLKLSIFHFLTPKRSVVDKVGIAPDETVTADPADIAAGKDAQLERALEYLSTGR